MIDSYQGYSSYHTNLIRTKVKETFKNLKTTTDGLTLEDYDSTLKTLFPRQLVYDFASYHRAAWEWLWNIYSGSYSNNSKKPPPFVLIISRGSGKTTFVEMAAVMIGALGIRPYTLIVRSTQDKADETVTNIASLLESEQIATYFPLLSERQLGKYGNPKAWRRELLRTASGYTVDGIGLDTAMRGAKIEENRPGFIIIDDIDDDKDSPKLTQKKIDRLSKSILPAGALNAAVLCTQNLVKKDGVFDSLSHHGAGSADFLMDRIIEGPHPAIKDLTYSPITLDDGRKYYRITGGTPTWPEGQGLERCEAQINEWGPTAFKAEAQHEVGDIKGGIYDEVEFIRMTAKDIPPLVKITVWIDPTQTSTDSSDSVGIQADGLGEDDRIYRLYSIEAAMTPEKAIEKGLLVCSILHASELGIETNVGGDLWKTIIRTVWNRLSGQEEGYKPHPMMNAFIDYESEGKTHYRMPKIMQVKATGSDGDKLHRNAPMLTDYELGNIIHVGDTVAATLEPALNRFPLKPLDLVDASIWSWMRLKRGRGKILLAGV